MHASAHFVKDFGRASSDAHTATDAKQSTTTEKIGSRTQSVTVDTITLPPNYHQPGCNSRGDKWGVHAYM
jgi:hypothetical protein